MGVFALTNIKKGQHLAYYTGDTLTKAELDARYPGKDTDAAYTFSLQNGTYIDAIRPDINNIARWINHSKRPNSCVSERDKTLEIRSTEPIHAGQEILIDYNPAAGNQDEGYQWAAHTPEHQPQPPDSPYTAPEPGLTTSHKNNYPTQSGKGLMAEWLGRALCESHGASSILDSVTFLAQKQDWMP
jgi:SET domain-containing protein